MGGMKRMGWVLGVFIVGGAMSSATERVLALPPNQSDNTGTNYWNNTAPRFERGSKLDSEIISNARRMKQDLDRAYAACAASNASAANLPRRLARGSAPDAPCISPECQRLNSLVQETRTFLNSLNSSQAERLRASQAFQIW